MVGQLVSGSHRQVNQLPNQTIYLFLYMLPPSYDWLTTKIIGLTLQRYSKHYINHYYDVIISRFSNGLLGN